jgi:predicted metal-binding membrane protein
MASLKRLAWRSPESWSLVLSGLASAALAIRVWSADPVAGAHALHQPAGSGGADPVVGALASSMADWSLMVVAMMVPLMAASVRMVAARSLWRRRHRAVIVFLSSYVLLWSVVGWVTLSVVTPLLARSSSPLPATAALLVAAAWQATAFKQRALMACHRTAPLAPCGWRATRDCFHFGVLSGLRCVASCWAMMLACALAHHSILVMAAASSVAWSERSTRVGQSWIGQRVSCVVLVACALLTVL